MDIQPNIPLTIVTQIAPDPGPVYTNSRVTIGPNFFEPANQPIKVYWALVIDRTSSDLKVVQNFTFTDYHNVPAILNQYNNDPRYLLVLSTRGIPTPNIPQGSFFNYLVTQFKAGPALQRIEQILATTYSGINYFAAYTLVSTFDGSMEQPLEFSETGLKLYETYTLQLIPEENPNGNGILYVPYPLY